LILFKLQQLFIHLQATGVNVVDRLAATKACLGQAAINIQAAEVFNPTETFIGKHAFIGNIKPLAMLRMPLQDMLIAQIPIGIDLINTNGEISKIVCRPHLLKQAFCNDSRVPEYA
jgi:hypothetical protein